MLLATGNPSMIQQALVDAPLWSLFVMPGVLTIIGLCVTRVLSGEVDEMVHSVDWEPGKLVINAE